MSPEGIIVDKLPKLKKPILIAGFDGWGNAMNISTGMISYLVRRFRAKTFARLNPDIFYRYDENRPHVHIDEGKLISIFPPGGSLYAAQNISETRDLVLLSADEPNLCWYRFANDLFGLCGRLGVDTMIFLGSLYDNVLHSDTIVSASITSEEILQRSKEISLAMASYQGPGAIQSLLLAESREKGFHGINLWSHCPHYLQGATHYGLMAHLGSLLSLLGGFDLETTDLDEKWAVLNQQIQTLVKNTPELQAIIDEIRKAKVRGSWERMSNMPDQHGNVINLKDFLDPK